MAKRKKKSPAALPKEPLEPPRLGSGGGGLGAAGRRSFGLLSGAGRRKV
jgi:hypothetical protein